MQLRVRISNKGKKKRKKKDLVLWEFTGNGSRSVMVWKISSEQKGKKAGLRGDDKSPVESCHG